MFIQTEDTPNPAVMKFLPGCDVLGSASVNSMEFSSLKDALKSPLAEVLFDIEGVMRVFFGSDFISVTRADDHDWAALKPQVLAAIMDHFVDGLPVLSEQFSDSGNSEKTDENETVEMIKAILEHRVRPALARDGGDVGFERFEDGIVYLRLKGACAGCPGATATLKMGVERLLCHFIPEVKEVQQVR